MNENKYFLPYQVRWLKDRSPVKIWDKSRRIGATYVQSYEDVEDCISGLVPAVWFSSADESAAKEYIEYCGMWARIFGVAAEDLGEVVLDSENDIKALVIKFANGTKIHALSSNPKAFRSKGGKVVLDEFAHHDDQDKMWAAARPCITWGFPLRILSTHNGTSCRYAKFIEAVKKGKLNWSLHATSIHKAVEDGLVAKIYGRPVTKEEEAAWLKDQHDNCFDENTWLQEYCCTPVDEASAFLTYDLIISCELNDILKPLSEIEGDLLVGMDIGRKKDLSVIWAAEKLGHLKYTRLTIELEKMPFHIQREILFEILRHPKFRRAGIDSTGIGMQLAEEAQREFGKYRVEDITFTAAMKEQLAYGLRTEMEDKAFRIPADFNVREDFHSVRKVVTASGHIRFDVSASEAKGHADRFWAACLCNNADSKNSGPILITSRKKRKAHELTNDF